MVSGDMVGAIAMTEPGAGSDLQGINTRAKLDSNGDYILNGSKVEFKKYPNWNISMKNCLFVYTALVRSCMSRTIFDQFLICDLKSLNNRGKVFHRPNSAVQLSLSLLFILWSRVNAAYFLLQVSKVFLECDIRQVFITNGILADVVIVVAITDGNAKSKAHGISLFLVEDGTPG